MEIKNNILKIFQGKILRDDFVRHTGIMVAGTGLVNIFNLIYQLGLVRWLSVEEYGALNSMIAMVMVVSQFTVPFRPVLARFFATFIARNESGRVQLLLKKAVRDLGLIAAIILIAFVLSSGPLAAWQQIENSSYVVLVGVVIALSTLAIVPGAFLWGAQRFVRLAGFGVFPTLLKLALGFAFIKAGLGVSGALSGYIVMPAAMLFLGFAFIKISEKHFVGEGGGDSDVPMAAIYKSFIPTGVALFSFTVLTNFDVILVKHFFLPRQAGFYSVAQMVGKIILFLPGAVAIVVFPKAASARARQTASFHFFKKGLLIITLFNALAVILCALAPALILKTLTGKSDPESVQLVPWFALAMTFYALTWLNIYYSLSIESFRFIKYLLFLAAAQTFIISIYHPALKNVLGVVTVFSFLSFITSFILTRSSEKLD